MRTVFLGTSSFAAAVLERLVAAGHSPGLVLTRPDRPSGRGRRLQAPPVAQTARALELPLAQPDSVNTQDARVAIEHAAPEAVVVCAFGALIKQPLLSEYEILNVHPSLLPRWRGAAPIERAIMAGDPVTGVSIMRLTEGLDSGPVSRVVQEPISAADTYGSLAQRLQKLGGDLLVDALEHPRPFLEQDEAGVTYAEKIGAPDRLLDPSRPAVELERVVRALHPHIGARAALADGTLIGVLRAALPGATDTHPTEPPETDGRSGVWAHEDRLFLGARQGVLELLEVQPPGGRAMDASSYLRGRGLPGS